MQANFIWAYGYNVCAIPLAAGALYPASRSLLPPWVAALAMAASSVSVVCGALTLRLWRPARDVVPLRCMQALKLPEH
jgi:Cu+-exporting ATPase